MSSFMILALAGSALAVPFAEHGHYNHRQMHEQHKKHHFFPSGAPHATGTGAPFALNNATGIYGTGAYGTAASTGFPVASGYSSVVSQAAAASGYASSSEVAVAAASDSSSCSRSTVHVTTTNRVTVTVTRSSSVDVATVTEDESSASVSATLNVRNKGFVEHWHQKSSVASSVAAASSTEASSTSVYVAPTTSTQAASTQASATSASSVSSAASASSSAASSSGKRGVAYNDASLTTPFEGAEQVSWGYNWGQASSGLSSAFNYVPLLWGTSSTFTDGWADSVTAALADGSTHLMSFNEPDNSGQANLSPEAAATAYKKYMQPYAGKALLGSPAVTNGADGMGLDWLDAFFTACDGCTINFVPIHWYATADSTAYFQEHVANASTVAGGKPVWVTEFGATDASDADVSTFLETVMPWMDEQSFVERYSYFMVSDGMLVNDGSVSSYGSTYMSYTS